MVARTFLAIDLSSSLRSILEQKIQRLKREISGIAWVNQENFHVTLKFFGDTTDTQVAEIHRRVEPVLPKFSPFDIEFRGFGVFPDTRLPRVLWTGIGGDVDVLTSLVTQVDRAVAPVGFQSDANAFHPHLTLGRIKKAHRRVGKTISASGVLSDPFCFGRLRVERVTLFKSDLRPNGSVYTKLWDVSFVGS